MQTFCNHFNFVSSQLHVYKTKYVTVQINIQISDLSNDG